MKAEGTVVNRRSVVADQASAVVVAENAVDDQAVEEDHHVEEALVAVVHSLVEVDSWDHHWVQGAAGSCSEAAGCLAA